MDIALSLFHTFLGAALGTLFTYVFLWRKPIDAFLESKAVSENDEMRRILLKLAPCSAEHLEKVAVIRMTSGDVYHLKTVLDIGTEVAKLACSTPESEMHSVNMRARVKGVPVFLRTRSIASIIPVDRYAAHFDEKVDHERGN